MASRMTAPETPNAARGALAGTRVLVTRPAHQAERLCELIEAEGGEVVRFPVLEIADPADGAALRSVIDRLETFDIAVFISPNAVTKAMNLILARRTLPPRLRLAAIGRQSAAELKHLGCPADIYPRQRFDSEALLAMEAMQPPAVAGMRIVIFRGEGGREHLGDTLRRRGAEVEYAEAYRRTRPEADTGRLMRLWVRGQLDIVTVTSSEGLRNLYDMVGKLGRQWLRDTPLVVLSERTAELARGLGFKHAPMVAEQASDEGIVRAVRQWRAQRGQ